MQALLLLGSSGRCGRRAEEDMMRALMIAVMTTMLTAAPLFAQERGGEDANGYVTGLHLPSIAPSSPKRFSPGGESATDAIDARQVRADINGHASTRSTATQHVMSA
jgi:hypothetical protein